MRNGDFSPSRFEAQQDACNLVCGKKISNNMENAVGLIAMAGKNVEVCVSLTQDLGKILGGLHRVQISGQCDIISSVQIAALALRHRQNKRQEQRIVVFVGSPVNASDAELKRLGGQLKKNKIAVDIVNFGENCAEENRAKLEVLHAAVNNHDNSFLVTLPPGERMLSQMIATTPIIQGTDASPSAGGSTSAAGNFDEYGGIDPNIDPELALALRMSLESAENERKAREAAESGDKATSNDTPLAPVPEGDAMDVDDDMDEELRAAIALSLQEAQPGSVTKEEKKDEMDVEEDDELALALKLSKQTDSAQEGQKSESEPVDANYMASVLLNLPGLNPDDPDVQELLKKAKEDEKSKDQEKKQ